MADRTGGETPTGQPPGRRRYEKRAPRITHKIKGRHVPAFKVDSCNSNYFLGAIASFAALATRNFTTVLALI